MRDEKVIYILLGEILVSHSAIEAASYAVSRTSATQGQGGGAREYDPRQLDSRECAMQDARAPQDASQDQVRSEHPL